ncbi:unnamed protein product, partial [marine sediment metagenome]
SIKFNISRATVVFPHPDKRLTIVPLEGDVPSPINRPPGNRNPSKSEIETCFPYLETQIALINPKIIVTLGNVPTQYLSRLGL